MRQLPSIEKRLTSAQKAGNELIDLAQSGYSGKVEFLMSEGVVQKMQYNVVKNIVKKVMPKISVSK
jgi:hypothetical protein